MIHKDSGMFRLTYRLATYHLAMAIAFACVSQEAFCGDHQVVEQRLADTVKYLSSDQMEGRGVGTKGIDLAAEFIAREFASIGLQTSVFDGGAFQKFAMVTKVELGPKEHNRLILIGPQVQGESAKPIELKLDDQFNPLSVGGSGRVSAKVVFAGYGITAKEHQFDEYADVVVEGKVVILIRKEPQQSNPHSNFDGNKASRYATFQSKIANAYEHGAAAVILVNDFQGIQEAETAAAKSFDEAVAKLGERQQAFAKEPSLSPEVVKNYRTQVSQLADQIQSSGKRLVAGDFDRILSFREAGVTPGRRTMPVVFASRSSIDPIIRAALNTDLESLEKEIDEGPTPHSHELNGWLAECETNIELQESEVKNVVAVLPGEGPHADETIVVGAHYDHLGMGGSGNSLAPGTIAIHNGADDNASGIAALLEIARDIMASGKKPNRRIVFIAFTGEEEGLIGSSHYVKQPKFPLEKTVAMVNLDMVGRLNDNKLIVYGTGTAAEFDSLIDDLNKRHDFTITKDPSGFGPSDHESFYTQKVPVFHLFTGTHNDYHRPSDDFEKINVEGMRRVSSFAGDIVRAIDAMEKSPEYRETKRAVRDRGGNRPYLGSIPDFARQVEGYALMGVVPESPAAQAGLQAGDVIIRLGESKIGSLEDIDSALRKHKAGDTVKVSVKRGDETTTFDVTLGTPR